MTTFLRTLILMNYVSASRFNVKLHKITITPKLVKKVKTNLDSAKVSGPECFPAMVLKYFVPELLYILAELFNICLKETCCRDCQKVSSVVAVFNSFGERSTAKNYRPVSLFSSVRRIFEKLVNNKLVDHLEKYGLFSDFQCGFRSSDQMQIFQQLYLIEWLELLLGLGVPVLQHLIYPRDFTGLGILVSLQTQAFKELQIGYLSSFHPSSVIDSFE